MPFIALAIAALLAFQLAGDYLVRSFNLPIPGSLLGLLGLTLTLIALGRVPVGLGKVSGGLLRHMMLLLAPAVVGVMENYQRVRQEWLPFVVAGVAGAVITLAVTAVVLQYLLRRQPQTEAPEAPEAVPGRKA